MAAPVLTPDEIAMTPPLALHRREEEGRLGGMVYSQPFARYLDAAARTQRAVDDGYGAWWRNRYLAARLKAQMMCYPHGGRAYLAILAMDRDEMSLATAAARCQQSEKWLNDMLFRFELLKREYLRIGARRKHRRSLSA